MYNLRYHIVSLVSVFMALALGLILGGLVVQQGTVERQQGALVEGLQEEYDGLRDENRGLTDENKLLTAYSAKVTDEWATGRLKGRTIIVLTNAGRESGTADAAEAIESAGGEVATVVILKPGLGVGTADMPESVTALLPDETDDPLASIAASLAIEWTTPLEERPMTQALVEAELLRIEGLDGGTMAAGLVDVAIADGGVDDAGIAIASAFGGSGAAVGAQVRGTENGVAEAARGAGLSSFDTLGSDAGRYTLIALMTGAAPGHYGTGPNAMALFPTQ